MILYQYASESTYFFLRYLPLADATWAVPGLAPWSTARAGDDWQVIN